MENIITIQDRLYPALAKEKIANQLATFTGGQKEKDRRTLSDCCAEVMKGTGNCVSDIDVYRGIVRAYFPNADVRFLMDIEINGAAPSEEEMAKLPEKPAPKVSAKKAAPAPAPKPAPAKPESIQLSLF